MNSGTGTPPIIVLKGLEGNAPTQLHGLQVYMAPHLDILIAFWWTVFFVTITYVATKNVLIPLYRKFRNR